ncbi:MAG: shikimate dehydrogenase [Desulfovibrio sp.]|nr:shikimate dehydrogenase [Desulfovibrio sp.]
MPTALYGIVGWPLERTLSPLLHNTGFQALGLPAVYLGWKIPPEQLTAFADSARLLDVQGLSVTMPHKTALMPLLDSVSEQARLTGAVNTVCRDGDRLRGENTDVTGFLCPLAEFDAENTDVLLLGAGGAARAAAAGLALRRFRRVFVATPSDRSHISLAGDFGCVPLAWKNRHDIRAGIVVNSTPLGMRGELADETPYDFEKAARPRDSRTPTAYDMVYDPHETRFLRDARLAGWNRVSGLSMFLAQGAAQFRLWTGRKLPPQAEGAVRVRLCAAGKIPEECPEKRIESAG